MADGVAGLCMSDGMSDGMADGVAGCSVRTS